ncbi:MAG: DinB family protein [Thermomicrobiales bacterium]
MIDRLFGHDRGMTNHYLELCRNLTDEQWDREFDVGMHTLRRSFDHMNEAVELWMGSMTGVPNHRELEDKTWDQLVGEHRSGYDRFETFARQVIADGRLDETFEDHWKVRHSYGASILHDHAQPDPPHEILHMLHGLGLDDLPEGDPQEWEWALRTRIGVLPPA